MKVKFNVGAMRIHLGNLFNNNQVLSASFHMFLNQNSKDILGRLLLFLLNFFFIPFNIIDELKEGLENGLSDIFIKIWNAVFNKIPIKLWLT